MITLYKTEPTNWARIRAGEKKVAEGTGISRLLVLPRRHTIEVVPAGMLDQAYDAREKSKDQQDIAASGIATYRIQDPEKVADAFDFSWDLRENMYAGSGEERLKTALREVFSTPARRFINERDLADLVHAHGELETRIRNETEERLQDEYGIAVQQIYVTNLAPTDREVAEALGAPTRQRLLIEKTRAEYGRRDEARKLEHDANKADLDNERMLERERADVIAARRDNDLAEARIEADAAELRLAAYASADPARLLAYAMVGFSERGVSNLHITPDLVQALEGLRNGT